MDLYSKYYFSRLPSCLKVVSSGLACIWVLPMHAREERCPRRCKEVPAHRPADGLGRDSQLPPEDSRRLRLAKPDKHLHLPRQKSVRPDKLDIKGTHLSPRCVKQEAGDDQAGLRQDVKAGSRQTSHQFLLLPFGVQSSVAKKTAGSRAVCGRLTPPRPWTPPQEALHASTHLLPALISPGASTDRSHVRKNRRMGFETSRRSTARVRTPYVDIVGRNPHLGLFGQMTFPSRTRMLAPQKSSIHSDSDPAEAQYQGLLQKFPHHVGTLREYALWLHNQGRSKEAEKHYFAALVQEPFNSKTLNATAMLLWEQNKAAKSQAMLKRAIQADPKNAPALLNYAIINFCLNRPEAAVRYFSHVLDIIPNQPTALLGCALAMEKLGNTSLESIESIYLRVLNKEPSNFDALYAYGRFLKVRRQDLAEAEFYYSEALKLRPQDANLLCSYGVLHMEKLQSDSCANAATFMKAAECFRESLERDHGNFEAVYNYACLISRRERCLPPISFETLEMPKENPHQDLQKLPVLTLSTRPDDRKDRLLLAEHLYRTASAMQPKNEDLLCSYALFLLDVPLYGEESISKAERLLSKVLRDNPQNSLAALHYVRLLCTHKPDEGYEKAAEIDRIAMRCNKSAEDDLKDDNNDVLDLHAPGVLVSGGSQRFGSPFGRRAPLTPGAGPTAVGVRRKLRYGGTELQEQYSELGHLRLLKRTIKRQSKEAGHDEKILQLGCEFLEDDDSLTGHIESQ